MRRLVVVLCATTAVLAVASPSPHDQWLQWKEVHGKIYENDASERARRATWQANRELVERHNQEADRHGFKLALNQFADQVRCSFSPNRLNYTAVYADINTTVVSINSCCLFATFFQTNEEFSKRYLSSLPVTWAPQSNSVAAERVARDGGLPYKLDWRKLGYVTPVSAV